MLPILIINSAPFTPTFIQPIVKLFTNKDLPFETVNYSNIPSQLDEYSGIIISASPRGDDIINEQLPFYKWLSTYTKPVLGSCHGHQLMAVLFGSSVIINDESEEGMHSIEILSNDNLFRNILKEHEVEQHHIKSVSLPDNFIQLAKSNRCQNQVIKHRKLPMYGCQFHIESQPILLMNFAELCRDYKL